MAHSADAPGADLASWRVDFLAPHTVPQSLLPTAVVVPDAPVKKGKQESKQKEALKEVRAAAGDSKSRKTS